MTRICVAWPVVVRIRVTVVVWVVVVIAVLVLAGIAMSEAVTLVASAGTVGVALASRLTRAPGSRAE